MLRALALSLILMVGLGAGFPLLTEYAEAGAFTHKKHKSKQRRYKKYSRNWWRAYYRRQNRSRYSAAQRRAVRLRRIQLAGAVRTVESGTPKVLPNISKKQTILDFAPVSVAAPALLPTGDAAPKGWKKRVEPMPTAAKTTKIAKAVTTAAMMMNSPSETQFNVDDESGANLGSASVSVVGSAIPGSGANAKTVGGVQTSALRRTVIEKMIREEGWVVNDYQKEIGGRKVFVVVAQSPGARGTIQSRLFYFTEVGGQIYSVATSAPSVNSQRLEQESERVIVSLGQRRNGAVQQAELK